MRALEQGTTPLRTGLLDGTPLPALAALAAAWALATLVLPASVARGIGLAAAHGGLLGTALAWTAPGRTCERRAPLDAALLLAIATLCTHMVPGGAIAYVLVPAWLLRRRVEWSDPGADRGRAMLAGGLFGLLLGAHLLVNASLTLGFHVRPGRPADLLGWFAYDLGANVLAAEAFFRAGLFRRAHRRWPFAAATAVSATASVARYLVDPLLPHSPEILAGATFYLTLLGVGNCWLLARYGSLAAPIAAGLVFFASYRLLAR